MVSVVGGPPHSITDVYLLLPPILFVIKSFQHMLQLKWHWHFSSLTLSNPIFLPTAYSPALICFGRERGWITCNYPTVLKKKNIENQKEYNLRYLLAKVRTT
jgi:hypothetical protein